MFGNNTFEKKVMRIIYQEEKHDKSSVISAIDLLKIMRNRFILMQKVLKPLVKALSNEILITNIYFAVELDGNFSINIDYIQNDKKGLLVLCRLMDDELEIFANTHKNKYADFINDNKKIIIDTLNNGLDESFDKEGELINSTSGLFTISINNNFLDIKNSDMHSTMDNFKLIVNFSSKRLFKSYKLLTSLKDVEEELNNEDNLVSFLNHVKVYEKSIPYYLKNNN